jgi:hypothetical protein
MEQRQQSRPESAQEEEIAAGIAALLAGFFAVTTTAALVNAISSLLQLLPGLPDFGSDEDETLSGASVTRSVARLVVRDRQTPGSSQTLRNAHVDNLLHRAHYAINATKRVVRSEDIRKGFAKERMYFAAHREAERRRTAGAKMVDAAIELHGPLLGWKHGHPKEPRPTHLQADGMNFDARSVPAYTGALPGVLPGCTCTVTAPFENGRVLR